MARDRELPVIRPDTYQVEGEVARGGIGRILKAHDAALGRTVAIKELLPGHRAAEGRFIREALVTARLEHPAIVPVHEAGRWPSGEPFYTMKLVSGRSLLEAIQEAPSFAVRMSLLPHVIQVADAIAYAHSKRVIHRDIKPSNVIIGAFGETLVIDWGLAKDLTFEPPASPGGDAGNTGNGTGNGKESSGSGRAPAAAMTDDTLLGTVMGTPAYMPPEQARGEPVDERADVYSLGALLYHVLSASSPYAPRGETPPNRVHRPDANSDTVSMEQRTRNVLKEAMQGKVVPLEERQPNVPQDLLTIVRKAMARDPAERYPSAKELADDLKRFQTGQLVSAHQYSTVDLARRWLRRNRAAALVGAGALLLVIALGVVSVGRVVKARAVAEAQREEAVSQRGLAQAAERQAETRAYELTLLQARASLDHDPTASLAWLKQYPVEGPGWREARAIALDAKSRGPAHDVWRAHEGTVTSLAVSPDGEWLVSGSEDRTVKLWSLDGTTRRTLGRHDDAVTAVAFAPDGKTVAAAGEDRRLVLWSLADGSRRDLGVADAVVSGIAFAPDGASVAAVSIDGTLRVAPVTGGSGELRALRGHGPGPATVAFSPDGAIIATGSEDKTIRLWPTAGAAAPRVIQAGERVGQVRFAGDGKTVVTTGENAVRLWDLAAGQSRAFPHPYPLDAVLTPDGAGLVSAGADGVIQRWDLRSGKARSLLGHDGMVRSLALSPDGKLLASGGKDGTIRLWRLEADGVRVLRGLDQGAQRPAFSPDGTRLAAGGSDGTVRIWEVASPEASGGVKVLAGAAGATRWLSWSPDGKRLATLSEDRVLRVWDAQRAEARVVVTTAAPGYRLRWAPDRDELLYTDGSDKLVLWDLARGSPRCQLGARGIGAAIYAPDGKAVAYAGDETVYLLDVASCRSQRLYQHDAAVSWLAFAPDGTLLASASKDRTAGLWSAAAGVRRLRGHNMDLYAVAFAPDGKTLATSSYDQTVRLWRVPGGELLRVLRGHEQAVGLLAFTPDGKTLVSSSLDRTLRVWSLDTGEGAVLRGHDDMIWGLAMSPDGTLAASASHDGTVRLWPVDASGGVPQDARGFARWLDVATTARMDAHNQIGSPL
jgi:eukaryotic-like serine/threonine-protein kinase